MAIGAAGAAAAGRWCQSAGVSRDDAKLYHGDHGAWYRHARWRLRHDGNPDRRGNRYPTKLRPERKIDAAVVLMMAVGRAMTADDGQADLVEFLRDPAFG
jgi:hypothetical protein